MIRNWFYSAKPAALPPRTWLASHPQFPSTAYAPWKEHEAPRRRAISLHFSQSQHCLHHLHAAALQIRAWSIFKSLPVCVHPIDQIVLKQDIKRKQHPVNLKIQHGLSFENKKNHKVSIHVVNNRTSNYLLCSERNLRKQGFSATNALIHNKGKKMFTWTAKLP